MSKDISIGSVTMAVADYAVGAAAVLGIRDSGKTVTSKGICEQLIEAGIQPIVFDAVGKWRWLKVAADHKDGKAYRIVVAGGRAPDLPLTQHSAPEIVRSALKARIPLVIDLYDPKLSKADWRRIVKEAIRIIHYENDGGAVHVFLEEAAEFVPQKVLDGEVYAEVEKLARMGGNNSVGLTLINQRSQEVNKAVLEQCTTLILGCQIGSKAIEAVEKWVDRLDATTAEAVTLSLPRLKSGEAWIWTRTDPDRPHRTQVPMCRSFHPDRRTPDVILRSKKPADTAEFVATLQATIPKVIEEAKANDPAILRRRIAELEKEAKQRSSIQQSTEDSLALQREAENIRREFQHNEEHNLKLFTDYRHAVSKCIEPVIDALESTLNHLRSVQDIPSPIIAVTKDFKLVMPKAVEKSMPISPVEMNVHLNSDGEISRAGSSILNALAWWQSLDQHMPSREMVAFVAGYRPSSGHYKNTLGSLRTRGFIEYPGEGLVMLSHAGRSHASYPDVVPSGAELKSMITGVLETAQRRIFEVLWKEHTLTREKLAIEAGFRDTSGHFKNMLGNMRSLSLCIYPSDGTVSLAEWVRKRQ